MIEFKIEIVGSYPKSINLGKTISRFRAGKIDSEKLEKAIEKEQERFFKIVKDINASVTTDGLFRWDDIVDVTFSYIDNVDKGELTRFFDNNFYYRRPVIAKEIVPRPEEYQKILEKDKELMKKVGLNSALAAVFLGPLTYLTLSDNRYYKDEELLHSYAKVTNEVMKKVSNVVDVIEIHEPSIFMQGVRTNVLNLLKEVYNEMLSGITKSTLLLGYFEIKISRLQYFFNLPVTYYGLDVIENKNKLGAIYKYFNDKSVFLGVLNTRNTKLERISSIKRIINGAYQKGKAKDVIIGNASMMDFIPEIIAKRKLYLLKKLLSSEEKLGAK